MPLRRLEAQLLHLYSGIVEDAHCASDCVVFENIFLEHVVCLNFLEEHTKIVVSLDHATKQAGALLPRQIFTRWKLQGIGGDDILFPCTNAAVPMLRRRRHGGAAVETGGMGSYQHLAERELTGHLLQPLFGRSVEQILAYDMRVEVRRLLVSRAIWQPDWGVAEEHDLFQVDGANLLQPTAPKT